MFFIPIGRGFAYLGAVMDWHTRAVLSWKLSNTLDTAFCLEAFEEAVRKAGRTSAVFNTDQGCQFTSRAWRECLEGHGVRLSMDGKGRRVDNVFIERLWRSLEYKEVYLREYRDLHDLERSLERWFGRYNTWRPHAGRPASLRNRPNLSLIRCELLSPSMAALVVQRSG